MCFSNDVDNSCVGIIPKTPCSRAFYDFYLLYIREVYRNIETIMPCLAVVHTNTIHQNQNLVIRPSTNRNIGQNSISASFSDIHACILLQEFIYALGRRLLYFFMLDDYYVFIDLLVGSFKEFSLNKHLI